MPRIPGLRRYLRISGASRVERHVDDELRFHLETRIDALVAQGMERHAASDQAALEFGDLDRVARDCERIDRLREGETRRGELFSSFVQDLTFAARAFRRTPLFTGVIVATLALGVGANTAIFSIVDRVLVRPLPYAEPERLAAIWMSGSEGSISKETLAEVLARQRAFSDLAGWSGWGFTLTGRDAPEELDGAIGTPNLFAVLGARAALGRTFLQTDASGSDGRVVVLGDALWRRRFGADPAIVGQRIALDGRDHTVLGVMPPTFHFPSARAELWVASPIDPVNRDDYEAGYLSVIGRLQAGATHEGAIADLRAVARRLHEERPDAYSEKFGREALVRGLRDQVTGRVATPLLVLLGAVGFVLLIACANIANLLLTRASVRRREIAIRTALGANRGRLIRQLLAESMLLAIAGGALGVLLAYGGSAALARLLPTDLPIAGEVGLDGRVLAFTLAVSVAAGVLFGLAPAIQLSRSDPQSSLRDGGRGGSAGADRRRVQKTLIVAEVALALVLVLGAGLMLRSFWRLSHVDPGFHADGVLALRIAPPSARYREDARVVAYLRQVVERIGELPGVASVGAVHLMPLGGNNWNPSLAIEGRPLAPNAEQREVDWRVATPGYFGTMRVPVLRGRSFVEQDVATTPPVALVNATLARRYFANEDPIGRRVRTAFEGDSSWATIVGVVGDTKDQSLSGPARPQMYRPHAQWATNGMAIMVRTADDPMRIARSVEQAIWSVDPDVPVSDVQPLERVIATSIGQPRLLLSLLGTFGAIALVLGAVGIYGVMSYAVSQRSREMAVRIALGARPGDVSRLVVRDALGVVLTGLAIGLAGALALTRVLASQLYEVRPTDPLTFVSVAAVLMSAALLASWLPARRAGKTDPIGALREDG